MGKSGYSTAAGSGKDESLSDVPGSIQFQILLKLLKKYYKFVVASMGLFGFTAALISIFVLPPEYLATASMMPKGKGGAEGLMGRLAGILPGGALGGMPINMEMEQLQELLNSRYLANRVQMALKKKLATEGIRIPKKLPRFQIRVVGQVFSLSTRGPEPQVVYLMLQTYLDQLQLHLNESSISQSRRMAEFINDRIGEVKESLDSLEKKLMALRVSDHTETEKGRSIESEVMRTKRDYAVEAKVLESLSQQHELAQIEAKRDDIQFIVLDPPVIPDSPVGPRKAVNTFLGMLAGFVFAMLTLTVLRRFKRLHWIEV